MVSILSLSISIISLAGATIVMLRKMLKGSVRICNCASPSNHTAIITGATSGIGEATAVELAKRHWKLILGCRDMLAGELIKNRIELETGNKNVSTLKLDLEDFESVKSFVSSMPEDTLVHLLINNAGIMSTQPRYNNALDNIDANMAVNFFGHFVLTIMLQNTFKRTFQKENKKPRIVIVSSALAKHGQLNGVSKPLSAAPEKDWQASTSYKNSKLACLLFARELEKRWNSANLDNFVDVYCIVTGGMVNTRLDREIISGLYYPIRLFIGYLKSLVLKAPFEGCQSILHCSISDNVFGAHLDQAISHCSGSGFLYRDCIPIHWPNNTEDMNISSAVWEHAERLSAR